ncbi:MAG TPA: ABC transporter permease [Fimbriimonadaceae bacterium]|nr:ABC transporter permease [Fimbriimonadaceae bacterium]
MDLAVLLVYAAPIALAALGELISQKSGVINIGLEGMMLLGAFFGMLAAYLTGSPWLGLGLGVSVGIAASLASGWFCISLGADQVVVGTAVNLFALGLTGSLFRARFGASGQLLSLPKLPQFFGIDPVILLMIASIPAVWWLLAKTGWGLVVRSAGEYPKATEAAGFSVNKFRFQAVAIGGAFAGLAGAYLSIGVAGSFAENMTNGRGFIAIAMVTFGRWKPLFVFLAAVLIGFFDSLQYLLQAKGVQVPSQLMLALPYVVALLVLVIVGKGTSAPASLGVAYRRED